MPLWAPSSSFPSHNSHRLQPRTDQSWPGGFVSQGAHDTSCIDVLSCGLRPLGHCFKPVRGNHRSWRRPCICFPRTGAQDGSSHPAFARSLGERTLCVLTQLSAVDEVGPGGSPKRPLHQSGDKCCFVIGPASCGVDPQGFSPTDHYRCFAKRGFRGRPFGFAWGRWFTGRRPGYFPPHGCVVLQHCGMVP